MPPGLGARRHPALSTDTAMLVFVHVGREVRGCGAPARSGPDAAQSPSAAGRTAAAGHVEVRIRPGDAVGRRLCVRPGAVVSLVLEPRLDDKRWTGVRSSVPALVLVSGRRMDADGTAHASLRCAGTRGGTAEVTAPAKAPDVAGAARVAFTLHVDVLPHTTRG
jgi:hypothetical protein